MVCILKQHAASALRPRRQRAVRTLSIAALTIFALMCALMNHGETFTGGRLVSTGMPARLIAVPRKAATYPALTRMEDLIFESCSVSDSEKSGECMKVYDKLLEIHFAAQEECDLDSLRCTVLEVLERIAERIKGTDGLVLLNEFRDAIGALSKNYDNYDKAFDAIDTDKSGDIDKAEMTEVFKKMGLSLSDSTVDALFKAADADGNGVIDKQEFADFVLAGCLAPVPLDELKPAMGGGTTEDLMKWVGRGRPGFKDIDTMLEG